MCPCARARARERERENEGERELQGFPLLSGITGSSHPVMLRAQGLDVTHFAHGASSARRSAEGLPVSMKRDYKSASPR